MKTSSEISRMTVFDGFPFGVAASFQWHDGEGYSEKDCLLRLARVLSEFDAYQIAIVGNKLEFLHWPKGRFPLLGIITSGKVTVSWAGSTWVVIYRFSTALWLGLVSVIVPISYFAPSLNNMEIPNLLEVLIGIGMATTLFILSYAFTFIRVEQLISRAFPRRQRR